MPQDNNWNWVTARQECSLTEQFRCLQMQAERDVETRNAQCGKDEFYKVRRAPGTFVVFVNLPNGIGVTFKLSEDEINIAPDNGTEFPVTVTLDRDRVCKFKVDGELLEIWQLLQKALEPVLFG